MAGNFQKNKEIGKSKIGHSTVEVSDVMTNIVSSPRPTLHEMLYPGMSRWPSCFCPAYLEFKFEVEPKIMGRLPVFSSQSVEPTYIFLMKFEEVTLMTEILHAPLDYIRFRYISLALWDDAKRWLYSLPPKSIGKWTEFVEVFLTKYVPKHDRWEFKREIYDFKQKDKEPFWKCFDRFLDAITQCPHHGIPLHVLCQILYDSLDSSTRTDLQVMCQGSYLDKSEDEAWKCLEEFAKTSRQWETIKEQFEIIDARRSADEAEKAKAEIIILKQRIQELEKIKESRSCDNQNQTPRCPPVPQMPQPKQPQRLPPPLRPPPVRPYPVHQNPQGFQIPRPNMPYYQNPVSTTPQAHVQQVQFPQTFPAPESFQIICNKCHSQIVVSHRPAVPFNGPPVQYRPAVPYSGPPVQFRPPVPYSHPSSSSLHQHPTPSNSVTIEQRIERMEMSMRKLLAESEKGILPTPFQKPANLGIPRSEAGGVNVESTLRMGNQNDNQNGQETCQNQMRGGQIKASVNAPHELFHARKSESKGSGGQLEHSQR